MHKTTVYRLVNAELHTKKQVITLAEHPGSLSCAIKLLEKVECNNVEQK